MLSEENFLPKLSAKDNKIHLVYVGLITQHTNKVRNMINYFKKIADKGFIIHVYPTRSKEYTEYRKIPNLILHQQLPVNKLIREISQYDFGITFLNNEIDDKLRLSEIKFGFWNKMYDYLMAGIPVLTTEFYEDMSDFIKKNKFGISLKKVEELSLNTISEINTSDIVKNILTNRDRWTMENQIQLVIEFYQKTLENFNAKA